MTTKRNNIHIIGVEEEEEEREKGIESVFEEIIAENFPNMGKEIVSWVMKEQRSPNTRDTRKKTPRHIIIKMANIKEEDRVLYIENPKESTPKLLELITKFSKVAGHKINTQKSVAFLCTNDELAENQENNSIYNGIKGNKISRNKPSQEGERSIP